MDKETIEALRGSIKKWEAIVAGTGKDEGPLNCSLCKLFYQGDCTGCPVMEKTGQIDCRDSPYEKYAEAAEDGIFVIEENEDGDEDIHYHRRATKEELTKLAQAELDFLVSLLPEGENV